MNKLRNAMLYGIMGNASTIDVGLALLRVFVGLMFMTVFEKFLPRNGVWGPQQWFIEDVAAMGFPFPVVFAWLAVLSEFLGGFGLILGLGTRFAALSNCVVTGVAALVYHEADVSQSGLAATTFFFMCTTLLICGPGRFSLDGWICRMRGNAKPPAQTAG